MTESEAAQAGESKTAIAKAQKDLQQSERATKHLEDRLAEDRKKSADDFALFQQRSENRINSLARQLECSQRDTKELEEPMDLPRGEGTLPAQAGGGRKEQGARIQAVGS